jgi:hypothetical protein
MGTMILIGIIALVAIVLVGMYIKYNNEEIALRKEAEAQKGKVESVHDQMWKVIQQKAGVTDEYRETFEKIYPEIISGRYNQDGSTAMKWIQESNPDFDTALYKDLMQAIEVQRSYFTQAQTRMLDILRQRDTLIESIPARFFISNKSKIDYTIITSTRTKTVTQTGIDDDVELFKKDKK